MRSRILFVSGHRDDARRLSQMLYALPMDLDHVVSVQQASARLRQEEYSAVLTEAALADGTWLEVLHLAEESSPPLKVIVTDRLADARLWAEVLNLGAYDVLAQPFDEFEVRRILSFVCSRPNYESYGHTQITAIPVTWAPPRNREHRLLN